MINKNIITMFTLFQVGTLNAAHQNTVESLSIVAMSIHSKLSDAEVEFLGGVGSSFTIHWLTRKKYNEINKEVNKMITRQDLLFLIQNYHLNVVQLEDFKINLVSAMIYQILVGQKISIGECIVIVREYNKLVGLSRKGL